MTSGNYTPTGNPTTTDLHSRATFAPSAAALLNPKSAFAGPATAQTTPSTSHTTSSTSTPLEFQFSTPTNITPEPLEFQFSAPSVDPQSAAAAFPSSEPLAPYGQSNGLVNGFGGMIERVNNVEQRTSIPHIKRRKVEDESNSSGSQSRFGSPRSGGMVGQYVKDKRESASQPSRGVETVDLTDGGDDAEVFEVQAPRNEEVCYGLIQNARLRCHKVPSPKPGAVSLMSANYWPFVKIVLNRKHGTANNLVQAYDHTRNIIGTLDGETASGLVPLLDSRLQLRTDCRIPARPKQAYEQPGSECSQEYKLDLMLYGPRKNAKTVGRHLSQRQLWLRNPPRVDPGIKYENPQLLEGPRPPAIVRERPTTVAQPAPMMRTVEEIRSEVMNVFDTLTRSEDLPETEPDERVQTSLLQHQKQGLHFMMTKEQPRQWKERGTGDSFWQVRYNRNGERLFHNVITGQAQREQPPETFGGILADMMGLGKTLSILALVCTTLGRAEEWSKQIPSQPSPPPQPKNAQRNRPFNVPAPAQLLLTNLVLNGKGTLLICPLSTLTNWEEQIKTHIKPGQLSYHIYHGNGKIKDAARLAEFDLVLTTYGSVSAEVGHRNKGKAGVFPLEEVGWFRVVLDEAHMIREQNTLLFKSACRLQAERRWAVTGTPVQNKLDDLAALFAFIRLKPFDEKGKFTQFITTPFKVCDPEIVPKLRVLVDSVTLRRLKDRINLPPRTDEIVRLDFSPSERKLYQLFEQNAQDKVQVLAAGKEKMIGGKTYIHILQSILRLRLISAHGRDLLSDADLQLVQGMTEDSAIDLDSDDDDDGDKPNLAETRVYEAFTLMQETNSDKCISCSRKISGNDESDSDSEKEDPVMGYMTSCFHLLCRTCINAWNNEVGNRGSGSCPFCQSYIRLACNEIRKSKAEVEHDGRNTKQEAKGKSVDNYTGPHTKTRALLDDLLRTNETNNKNPGEAPIKSVVFSGWTSHLDLIQMALDNVGIGYTRLDGRMSRLARTNAMTKFREDNSVHVILVSIMAGGLGLNLTSGSNVFVMEPQYNPAAEAQAIDRVHRLGQNRPVRTVRYIMRDSIEVKMLELQDKKMKLASLSMDRNRVMDKSEAAKQKLMDLRSLFK